MMEPQRGDRATNQGRPVGAPGVGCGPGPRGCASLHPWLLPDAPLVRQDTTPGRLGDEARRRPPTNRPAHRYEFREHPAGGELNGPEGAVSVRTILPVSVAAALLLGWAADAVLGAGQPPPPT